MGIFYQNKSERYLSTKFIAESAKLLGQEALLYQIESKVRDNNNDPSILYANPVKINILFDENPKPILKRYGWYVEDEELPYLAYITRLADDYSEVEITDDCIIEVNEHQLESDTSVPHKFIVTNTRGNMVNPLYWVCKLAPYRDEVYKSTVKDYESPQDTGLGYKYIKRTKHNKF